MGKKRFRKGEKTRCCYGSKAPEVSLWRLAAACDVMWTHRWCPRFLQRVSDAGPACAAALYLSKRGSMRMRRPEWQWRSLLTSTTRGVVRLLIFCGTRAVRLGLREAASCRREVIFSGGHERYCCVRATPPPRGTQQCCISTPAAALCAARCSNTDGKDRANRGHIFMQQFCCWPENDLQEILVEFQVWIRIISGFSKNSFYSNVLLIQERKILEYLSNYKTCAHAVRIQCCDVVNNLKITYITIKRAAFSWCEMAPSPGHLHHLQIKMNVKKGIKLRCGSGSSQMCALKKKEAKIEYRVNVIFNQHLKTTWANESFCLQRCGFWGSLNKRNDIFSQ